MGRKDGVWQLVNASLGFNLVNLAVAGVLVMGVIVLTQDSRIVILACLAYVLQALAYTVYNHQTLAFRFSYQFDTLLTVRVFFSITRFLLQLLSILLYGLERFFVDRGFCIFDTCDHPLA